MVLLLYCIVYCFGLTILRVDGGLLFGSLFGAVAAIGVVFYIAMVWLAQLIPALGSAALAAAHRRLRGEAPLTVTFRPPGGAL